jgi:acetylornithine deacetylase/succinyl-diaminopimelate desuccinylase-like protein
MVPSVQETLFQYISAHLSAYQKRWEQTYTQLNECTRLQDTPGIQEVIIAQLQDHAMKTRLLDANGPLIYGELHTGAPATLLFYTPYDTGYHASRQVVPLSAGLAALDAYQAAIGPLPVNIKWVFDAAGTSGTPDLATIIAEFRTLLQADGCIWTMPEQPEETGVALLAPGTKGLLRVELTVQTTDDHAHDETFAMHGAVVPDAAWRLTWALNHLKGAHEEILIEGFYDTLISAEDDEVALLYTLPDNTQAQARRWGLQQLLLGLQGFQFHYAHLLTPSCTISNISSGNQAKSISYTPASIPIYARAQVDFYLVPGQDPHDIFAKLQQHLQAQGFPDVQARLLYAIPPVRTPLSDPFVQVVRQASIAAYGDALRVLPGTAGTYPLYPFRDILKMPVVIITEGSSDKTQKARNNNQELPEPEVPNLAGRIKQMAMIIEGIGHAAHTTQ